MSRLRYLNPWKIRDLAKELRRAGSGGGPKRLRLIRVGEPRGVLVPIAEVEFELVAADGSVNRFSAPLPVPWLYAWGYRLARMLGVPLISAIDHDRIHFELPIPRPDRG